jgi:hypothetical protein
MKILPVLSREIFFNDFVDFKGINLLAFGEQAFVTGSIKGSFA